MKPGYKTTEFWVTELAALGAVLFAIADKLPPRIAAYVVLGGNAAYAISRGLAKVYPPKPGP